MTKRFAQAKLPTSDRIPDAETVLRGDSLKEDLVVLDKEHFWHPFTQMKGWCAVDHEPLIIESGRGSLLYDIDGREYVDGNASIWTNIHGHNHPVINQAIRDQLDRVAHCSSLGATNEPAIRLAKKLVDFFPANTLTKVFFTDNGSTAMECALKMAIQFWQLKSRPDKRHFIGFDRAYHGDTLGAASLGGINTFHERFSRFGFKARRAGSLEDLRSLSSDEVKSLAAVAIEPLVQGAAGIRMWPLGMLRELRGWCNENDVLLILDEVMTGFGRTGTMFACEQEGVVPDFLALAKGLTGGYLPLAATLTTEPVFNAFLGEFDELKTFFHGHSYCGNPLGCAAALASLQVFEQEDTLKNLQGKIERLKLLLRVLQKENKHVAETRQLGLIAGIDVAKDSESGTGYPWTAQTGRRICAAARKRGLLTRPILDTIVLMPPLCITEAQLEQAVEAIHLATLEVCSP